jgi:hypothetical protein
MHLQFAHEKSARNGQKSGNGIDVGISKEVLSGSWSLGQEIQTVNLASQAQAMLAWLFLSCGSEQDRQSALRSASPEISQIEEQRQAIFCASTKAGTTTASVSSLEKTPKRWPPKECRGSTLDTSITSFIQWQYNANRGIFYIVLLSL